jgi:hypothetical protein
VRTRAQIVRVFIAAAAQERDHCPTATDGPRSVGTAAVRYLCNMWGLIGLIRGKPAAQLRHAISVDMNAAPPRVAEHPLLTQAIQKSRNYLTPRADHLSQLVLPEVMRDLRPCRCRVAELIGQGQKCPYEAYKYWIGRQAA